MRFPREQFVAAMERDRADRGLADATERAAEAVRGLVVDGPVRLVQTERARLTQLIERAEQHAALFEEAIVRFAGQKQAHHVEAEEHAELVTHAKKTAEHTRHTVTAELETRAPTGKRPRGSSRAPPRRERRSEGGEVRAQAHRRPEPVSYTHLRAHET